MKHSKKHMVRHLAWIKEHAPDTFPKPKFIGTLEQIMAAKKEVQAEKQSA